MSTDGLPMGDFEQGEDLTDLAHAAAAQGEPFAAHGRAAPNLDADAPTFSSAYGPGHLAADRRRGLVSLARLPPWPADGQGEPAAGHGWGPPLNAMLSGGLRPGEMLALGAASAGAGKTAFLMQLADGLALRNGRILAGEEGWGSAITPVLIASEMSAAALSWRTLARWTGHSASYFRGGESLAHKPGAPQAWLDADRALSDGELAQARSWMRLIEPSKVASALDDGAVAFVAYLSTLVEAWRERIARELPGRDVVPVVVVDPVQRYQGGDDEVQALNTLARSLCAATVERNWIALMTSDTNKAAASGRSDTERDEEEGAAVFRGSYGLQHEVSSALYLRRVKGSELTIDEADEKSGLRYVETVLVKARWGGGRPPWPRFRWIGPTARFWPMSEEATRAHDRLIEEARMAAKEKAASSSRGSGNTFASKKGGWDGIS